MNSKFLKITMLVIGTSAFFFAQVHAAMPAPAKDEGGCPAGGCVSGHCESPPDPDTNANVQLPDQAVVQPTKVTPTGEKQVATDTVNYHSTTHVWQPAERHHTTHKHRVLVKRYWPKTVYHPTFRRINRIVRTGETFEETMPTEEVVAPPVDYGCDGVAEVVPVVPVAVPVPVIAPYWY